MRLSGHSFQVETQLLFDQQQTLWLDIAMLRVQIAQLKDHLSEHLRAVEGGAEIEVTDRDRPIARIVPLPNGPSRIRIIPARRKFEQIKNRKYPAGKWKIDPVDLLLEERGRR